MTISLKMKQVLSPTYPVLPALILHATDGVNLDHTNEKKLRLEWH